MNVWWNASGTLAVIANSDKFNIYEYNKKNHSLT